jgi:putative transposase
MPRATQRYRSLKETPDRLVAHLRILVAARPRAGYRTLGRLLRREGVRVNDKRVYRLYRSEGLSLRVKRRRRHATSARVVPQPAIRAWQRWAMDFMSDSRTNGPEFVSKALDQWLTPTASRSTSAAPGNRSTTPSSRASTDAYATSASNELALRPGASTRGHRRLARHSVLLSIRERTSRLGQFSGGTSLPADIADTLVRGGAHRGCMPWKEAEGGLVNMAELCRMFGVSRQTRYT